MALLEGAGSRRPSRRRWRGPRRPADHLGAIGLVARDTSCPSARSAGRLTRVDVVVEQDDTLTPRSRPSSTDAAEQRGRVDEQTLASQCFDTYAPARRCWRGRSAPSPRRPPGWPAPRRSTRPVGREDGGAVARGRGRREREGSRRGGSATRVGAPGDGAPVVHRPGQHEAHARAALGEAVEDGPRGGSASPSRLVARATSAKHSAKNEVWWRTTACPTAGSTVTLVRTRWTCSKVSWSRSISPSASTETS
jgi:hypothetical protein